MIELLVGFIILATAIITLYVISKPLGALILKRFGRTISLAKGMAESDREAGLMFMAEITALTCTFVLIIVVSLEIGTGVLS